MELDSAIEERHSVRKFSSKKPDWRKIILAIDAGNKAPLAGNISTLKFILVDDREKIQKIADACQQDFVADVSYIVILCSNTAQVVREYGERGKIYSRQQAGAAIENFFLKITDERMATCWVGAFSDVMIKNILTIPDNVEVEAIFPIGFEYQKTKQKRKMELDNVLFFNKYGQKRMRPIHETNVEKIK